MYDNGQGVPQDYAAAASWYRKAAEQGDAVAQVNLGVMYRDGQGVPQDYAAAVSWYRKAAEQGYANAQFNLGLMYANGQGVPQDYVTAHMWFNLAAASGDNERGRKSGYGRRADDARADRGSAEAGPRVEAEIGHRTGPSLVYSLAAPGP